MSPNNSPGLLRSFSPGLLTNSSALASLGMYYVALSGPSGSPVSFPAGGVTFDHPDTNTTSPRTGDDDPGWYVWSPDTGVWHAVPPQPGGGRRLLTKTGGGLSTASATAAGFYNVDRNYKTSCLRGKLVSSSGSPCPGVHVSAAGPDGVASSDATSDDGSFCVEGPQAGGVSGGACAWAAVDSSLYRSARFIHICLIHTRRSLRHSSCPSHAGGYSYAARLSVGKSPAPAATWSFPSSPGTCGGGGGACADAPADVVSDGDCPAEEPPSPPDAPPAPPPPPPNATDPAVMCLTHKQVNFLGVGFLRQSHLNSTQLRRATSASTRSSAAGGSSRLAARSSALRCAQRTHLASSSRDDTPADARSSRSCTAICSSAGDICSDDGGPDLGKVSNATDVTEYLYAVASSYCDDAKTACAMCQPNPKPSSCLPPCAANAICPGELAACRGCIDHQRGGQCLDVCDATIQAIDDQLYGNCAGTCPP